jgi:putative toxin-antitoxin system antitoxin component (TIGR02293 family)
MNLVATMKSLGGAAVLGREARSEMEAVEMVEDGLPAGTIARLQSLGGLAESDLASIIPRRTLSHLKKSSRLSTEQSDRIARAAGVFQMAHEAFGSRDKANAWMRHPNRALGGKAPLALLRTGSGAQLVEDVLTRIAYGVYG